MHSLVFITSCLKHILLHLVRESCSVRRADTFMAMASLAWQVRLETSSPHPPRLLAFLH